MTRALGVKIHLCIRGNVLDAIALGKVRDVRVVTRHAGASFGRRAGASVRAGRVWFAPEY